jgi:cellulose synthase/poly-beta-1,6-N-acetylglucosamine synthase-like glycosyltransferase
VWLLWNVSRFEKIRPDAKADEKCRPGLRVAMIPTKAPSEPWSVARKTLEGILAQEVPEGVTMHAWIADERPSEETLAWCAENGVRVSTRFGLEEYHQPEWPRRTKCKEGNLRYWYENHIDEYDVVCQFDADHVPRPDYLRRVLWRFNDEKVGYVAMPNLSTRAPCWFGRARRELEAPYYGSFLGSLGARFDDSSFFMPSCTGSHYAVSTAAVRAIGGGLGPELDEDLSTTMMISKAGFVGAFAVDAIADGDGPETLEDGLVQEKQWSRSATLLFTRWFKATFPRKGARSGAIVRSALIALWYATLPLWIAWYVGGPIAAFYSGWCIPDESSTTKIPCAFNMTDIFTMTAPAWFVNIGWEAYQKRRGWMRPIDSPAFSVLALPYRALRVLYMTIGIAAGFAQLVFGKTPSFRVTNKGASDDAKRLPWSALWPLYAICFVMSAVLWTSLVYDHAIFNGMYVWLTQTIFALISAMSVAFHAIEQRGKKMSRGLVVDFVAHGFSIAAVMSSSVLLGALPQSRPLIFTSTVAYATFVPLWNGTYDIWLTSGFLIFGAVSMIVLPLLAWHPAPKIADVAAAPEVPVVVESEM